jgi:hypothetical protein
MKRLCVPLIFLLNIAVWAAALDLSTAPSQDLLAVYRQLRTIQGGDKAATIENIVFKRDSATFTFVSGRITFAAPVADRILAARFQGEGIFELNPPHPIDKRQIARFAQGPKLTDSFTDVVFYFSDNTYEEMEKLMKVTSAPSSDPAIFASSQKKFVENFNDWYDNQLKNQPVVRNIAARMLADLTDSSSQGFFLADFKAKKSGDLLFHISWNRDSLLVPEYHKSEEVVLLHLNPGNYYEWWSGFHLSSEYKQSPRPDHRALLAHCPAAQIDLLVNNKNEISATAQLEYEVSQSSLRVLPFFLSGVLRISSIEDGAGNPVSFIQEDRKLDSDPWLILAEPAKPGQKYKAKIIYKEDSTRDSRLVHQLGSGLYQVVERASWFPSFAVIEDRTMFEIRARSPKKFKFLATGQLINSEKGKDELLTTWKTESPVSVIGFNYGDFVESSQVLADLKITAYSGRDIPNELNAILNDSSVGELAAMSGGTRNVEANQGVLRGGFNTSRSVKDAAALSLNAFKFFEFLFGPLPFKNISVTQQPVRGYAQSWPYLIFLPYDVFLDSTTRNALGLSDFREQREFYQTVAIHEMAHQWCGHLVGWKTYHDQWLSEGIADFAAGSYLRYFMPQEVNTFWNIRRTTLLQKNTLGYRPAEVGPVWLNPQLNEYNGWGNSQAMIYYKGGYVMEMLRALMYDPKLKEPNGRFIAMMREFTKTFAGQNASTEDFRKIVDKHNGRSMEWFFNQWVYGTHIPTYDFKYELKDAGGGQTEVVISLTQSDVPDNFYMQLPLYISSGGKLEHVGLVGVTGTRPLNTSFKLSGKPDKVLLDPERSVFADIRQ